MNPTNNTLGCDELKYSEPGFGETVMEGVGYYGGKITGALGGSRIGGLSGTVVGSDVGGRIGAKAGKAYGKVLDQVVKHEGKQLDEYMDQAKKSGMNDFQAAKYASDMVYGDDHTF